MPVPASAPVTPLSLGALTVAVAASLSPPSSDTSSSEGSAAFVPMSPRAPLAGAAAGPAIPQASVVSDDGPGRSSDAAAGAGTAGVGAEDVGGPLRPALALVGARAGGPVPAFDVAGRQYFPASGLFLWPVLRVGGVSVPILPLFVQGRFQHAQEMHGTPASRHGHRVLP